MNSIQIHIKATPEQQEVLIAQLFGLGASGFQETEEALLAYFPLIDYQESEVREMLSGFTCEISALEEKNWNEEWEKNFQPVVVRDFCSVRAAFHSPMQETRHEIIITPKMSFGTGHHATTWMMIDQMSAIDFYGKEVFDFGTGTGILSILAEKLGASSITAIDVDDWSVKNTEENITENNCSRIEVFESTQLPEKQFDIILANINRNVLLNYMEGLKKISKTDGIVLLSGLLLTDEEAISISAEQQGFKLYNRGEKDNWISLVFRN